MNAEDGDITRTSPDDRLTKTSGVAVAVAIPLTSFRAEPSRNRARLECPQSVVDRRTRMAPMAPPRSRWLPQPAVIW